MSGHGAGHIDPANKKVALLIAVFALVLAFAETLGKAAQTSALGYHIESSNRYARRRYAPPPRRWRPNTVRRRRRL